MARPVSTDATRSHQFPLSLFSLFPCMQGKVWALSPHSNQMPLDQPDPKERTTVTTPAPSLPPNSMRPQVGLIGIIQRLIDVTQCKSQSMSLIWAHQLTLRGTPSSGCLQDQPLKAKSYLGRSNPTPQLPSNACGVLTATHMSSQSFSDPTGSETMQHFFEHPTWSDWRDALKEAQHCCHTFPTCPRPSS